MASFRSAALSEERYVALYDKDKRFSVGWMIGGTVLMFITNFFGGFVAVAAGVTSIYVFAAIGVACFAVGGFVIGWKSEGQTIIEAGLAAAIATGISLGLKGSAALALLEPVALAIGVAIPFLAGIIGAWIGEKVQGDTIETGD